MGESVEMLDLAEMFTRPNGVFVLKVRGDSMVDDHLCDGDWVVIERRHDARNGETVVAMLETGETTLCRYTREGRNVRLQHANKTAAERVVAADRVRVVGVVIGVVRSLAA